jgi:hypothetical protein
MDVSSKLPSVRSLALPLVTLTLATACSLVTRDYSSGEIGGAGGEPAGGTTSSVDGQGGLSQWAGEDARASLGGDFAGGSDGSPQPTGGSPENLGGAAAGGAGVDESGAGESGAGGAGTGLAGAAGDGNARDCTHDDQCPALGACSVGRCTPDGACAQRLLPEGESCEDKSFCNGDESCDGKGSCRVGAARCSAPTICNETERRCVGCIAATDCPSETPYCSSAGQCVCKADSDCGIAAECHTRRCDVALGTCVTENVSDGTPVGQQTAGDCQARRCEGGVATVVPDDTDVPSDPGGGCMRPACLNGAPTSVPRAASTLCGSAASECSAADTCDGSGHCLPNDLPAGTIVRAASSSNCFQRTCGAQGKVQETALDAVCPGLFGTGHCLGSSPPGLCVECTDATVVADCGGPETGCNAGKCYATCDCQQDQACSRNYGKLCQR